MGDFRGNAEDELKDKQVCGYFNEETLTPFFS